MKLSRMSYVYLIAGVLSVIATLSIFLVNSNQGYAIHVWLGFVAMIYGEIAFFGGMILIERYAQERNLLILKTGGGIVVGVYALLTFLLSLIYMNVEYASPFTFLSFLVILLVYTLIVEGIFIIVSRRVFKKENKLTSGKLTDRYLGELELIEVPQPYQDRMKMLKQAIISLEDAQAVDIEERFYETVGELQELMRVYSDEMEIKLNELLMTLEEMANMDSGE